MTELPLSTLEKILAAAKAEFLEKGYQSASLRNIVKSAGVTTGAFYGYYSSKEALFAALVDEPYRFVLRTYRAAVSQFEQLQPQTQVLRMGDAGKDCMQALLLYMDARRDAFHLILECADGTPYSHAEGEKKRLALSVVLIIRPVRHAGACTVLLHVPARVPVRGWKCDGGRCDPVVPAVAGRLCRRASDRRAARRNGI